MKRSLIALVLVLAAPLAAGADTTKEDLKKLAKAGCGDEVLLAYLRANGPLASVSSDDLVELKAAGLSDKVLAALLAPPPAAAVTPAPAAGPTELNAYRVVPEPPRETYYVERPVYYSTYPAVSTYYVPSYSWGYRSCSPGWSSYTRYGSRGSYSYWGPSLSVGYSWGRHRHGGWSVGVRW